MASIQNTDTVSDVYDIDEVYMSILAERTVDWMSWSLFYRRLRNSLVSELSDNDSKILEYIENELKKFRGPQW